MSLDKNPIAIKAVTSAVLTLAGDLICQVYYGMQCGMGFVVTFRHPGATKLLLALVAMKLLPSFMVRVVEALEYRP